MKWWDAVVNYYKMVGEKYGVDPVIFVGIHIVATPLFALAVWWIIYKSKRNNHWYSLLLLQPLFLMPQIFILLFLE